MPSPVYQEETTYSNEQVWAVYTLVDPREPGVVRYVGVTNEPDRRLREHRNRALSGEDRTHCGRWKRKLLTAGFMPVLTVLESGQGVGWEEAEARWVAHFRTLHGDLLCNLTEGGRGVRGHVCSEATRQKIRVIHTGMKASPEARQHMSLAQLGRKASPATKAKMSQAHQGCGKSSDHRVKIGEALRGNQNGLGRKDSAEVKAKRNAAVRAAWAKRKSQGAIHAI